MGGPNTRDSESEGSGSDYAEQDEASQMRSKSGRTIQKTKRLCDEIPVTRLMLEQPRSQGNSTPEKSAAAERRRRSQSPVASQQKDKPTVESQDSSHEELVNLQATTMGGPNNRDSDAENSGSAFMEQDKAFQMKSKSVRTIHKTKRLCEKFQPRGSCWNSPEARGTPLRQKALGKSADEIVQAQWRATIMPSLQPRVKTARTTN